MSKNPKKIVKTDTRFLECKRDELSDLCLQSGFVVKRVRGRYTICDKDLSETSGSTICEGLYYIAADRHGAISWLFGYLYARSVFKKEPNEKQ